MDSRHASFDAALGRKALGDLGKRDVPLVGLHQGENERLVPI